MSTELQRMTAQRAVFFLERFKREEKMLGPNEQAALDFAMATLSQQAEAQPAQACEVTDEQIIRAAVSAPVVPDGFALVPVSLLIEAEESVDDYLSGIGSGSHDRRAQENLQAAIAASQQNGGQ